MIEKILTALSIAALVVALVVGVLLLVLGQAAITFGIPALVLWLAWRIAIEPLTGAPPLSLWQALALAMFVVLVRATVRMQC